MERVCHTVFLLFYSTTLLLNSFAERSEALEIGQELIDRHVGQQTSKESGMTFSPDRLAKKIDGDKNIFGGCRYYQLVEDDENKPLNAGEDDGDKKQSFPVAECNEKFSKLLKPIFNDILTDDNQVSRTSLLKFKIFQFSIFSPSSTADYPQMTISLDIFNFPENWTM